MPSDDHLDGRDVDAEFAAIIAGWDSVPDLPPSLTDEPDTSVPDPTSPPTADADRPSDEAADPGRAGPGPAPASDASGHAARPDEPMSDADAVAPATPAGPSGPAPSDGEVPPPGIVEAGLEEGHFEPRPVQLPPQEDLHFWGIVIGLTVGPLLLLYLAFFGENHSPWWMYGAFALAIGGFALLVLRQPRKRDDDDHDDGARL